MRVLVTGCTGFVGRVLCDVLARSHYTVRGALRSDRAVPDCISERAVVGDIGAKTRWDAALRGVDAVIHAAARAHVLNELQSEERYSEVNALGSLELARAAAAAGVGRFIYLSSIKVNGKMTSGRSYSATDTPHPCDAYARSKWLGEQHLWDIARASGMQSVVVRSPLVYGPGVRANFLRLLRCVDREWPVPLGAVDNLRSLVSVWNLCDLLAHVLEHPAAPGRTWLVSDGEDLSTPELMRRIGAAMNRRVRLFSVPLWGLKAVATFLGRGEEIARLCGSLTVDITATCSELGWLPPLTIEAGLSRTVPWYLSERWTGGT